MTDYFALMGVPRRPWIDEAQLKERFLALSNQMHPDRVHSEGADATRAAGERFAELNAAHQCLRDPRERLRHLLELETGARPADIQPVPAELADGFFEVGQICRETDQLLAEKSRAASPLAKAAIFERGLEQTSKLQNVQARLAQRRGDFLAELKAIDSAWGVQAAAARPFERLQEIARHLGYLGRWLAQIDERIAQLAA